MTAEIIDGKAFAAGIHEKVKKETAAFVAATGSRPGLAVVLVGDDPASHVYVKNKNIHAKTAGFLSQTHRFDGTIDQATLMTRIAQLNADPEIHGILVQLPLPDHLNQRSVLSAINPDKDVDGFHPVNIGRLWIGETAPVPCTPLGCALILENWVGKTLGGKKALLIGRSNIVGKPMVALLLQAGATVTIAHSQSVDVREICRQSDIVVVAVGRPEMVKGDWIKPGAVVLDVGINRVVTGDRTRLLGDVEFAAAKRVAGAITPVPGGIGPMTIACLLQNTLNQAKRFFVGKC